LPVPILDPRVCAKLVCEQPDAKAVAILFGRERTGLTNAELDRCHYLVQIPGNPEYPSLNIAAAVQIIVYELRLLDGHGANAGQTGIGYATAQQMEQFYDHLAETLVELEFLDPANPKQLMRRLRRLFGRTRPDQNEINILRGILTAMNKKCR
jgi:TrmH family RNA methyltransferase